MKISKMVLVHNLRIKPKVMGMLNKLLSGIGMLKSLAEVLENQNHQDIMQLSGNLMEEIFDTEHSSSVRIFHTGSFPFCTVVQLD